MSECLCISEYLCFGLYVCPSVCEQVRCQFDRYPAHCEQAARVVATVADVEMLDRIATSDINKFLYQYSSDGDILQVHSNVVSDDLYSLVLLTVIILYWAIRMEF